MRENTFVNYLDQFNVLSPNHAKIYDEYTHDQESEHTYSFTIRTKVEEFLIKTFTENPQSIILTGNAGDGKTRLCRLVHNHFANEALVSQTIQFNEVAARQLLEIINKEFKNI